MSDDNIDYRLMYPYPRRKKRFTESPRKPPKPVKKIPPGFFGPPREKRTPAPLKETTLQFRVKKLMFNDPRLSPEEIAERLGVKERFQLLDVSNIRAEYVHSVKFLIREGIKGLRA